MGIDKTQCREYWESLQDDSTVAFTGKHDVLCLLGEIDTLEDDLLKANDICVAKTSKLIPPLPKKEASE